MAMALMLAGARNLVPGVKTMMGKDEVIRFDVTLNDNNSIGHFQFLLKNSIWYHQKSVIFHNLSVQNFCTLYV